MSISSTFLLILSIAIIVVYSIAKSASQGISVSAKSKLATSLTGILVIGVAIFSSVATTMVLGVSDDGETAIAGIPAEAYDVILVLLGITAICLGSIAISDSSLKTSSDYSGDKDVSSKQKTVKNTMTLVIVLGVATTLFSGSKLVGNLRTGGAALARHPSQRKEGNSPRFGYSPG